MSHDDLRSLTLRRVGYGGGYFLSRSIRQEFQFRVKPERLVHPTDITKHDGL